MITHLVCLVRILPVKVSKKVTRVKYLNYLQEVFFSTNTRTRVSSRQFVWFFAAAAQAMITAIEQRALLPLHLFVITVQRGNRSVKIESVEINLRKIQLDFAWEISQEQIEHVFGVSISHVTNRLGNYVSLIIDYSLKQDLLVRR